MTNPIVIDSLNEIIRRIILVAKPLKIILFGSAVNGNMGPNSDLDLMVVVQSPIHRRKTAQIIYQQLIGVNMAADILVVTDEDLERYKDDHGTVIRPALREGKIVYVS